MPWARIDDMLPVHPKVRALSDSAFRLYICAICWSSLNITDGYIPADQIRHVSDVRRPQQCAEQLVSVGLWERAVNGWRIHDYLEYQPSAEKVARERDLKRQRQQRWRSSVDASQDASTDEPVDTSQDASQDASSGARAHPIPSHGGSVVDQPSDRNGRATADWIDKTRQAIKERTGQIVTDEQASAIATQIMGSQSVRNPAAYIVAAINRDPNPRRFLPASHPASAPPHEALLAAGISPRHKPARGDTVTRLAAQARAAINREDP